MEYVINVEMKPMQREHQAEGHYCKLRCLTVKVLSNDSEQ